MPNTADQRPVSLKWYRGNLHLTQEQVEALRHRPGDPVFKLGEPLMTNREYMRKEGKLPPELIKFFNEFYRFDLHLVRIRVEQVRAYGQDWDAVTRGRTISVDTDFWFRARVDASAMLQLLAHELWHVFEYVRRSWRTRLLEWLGIIARYQQAGYKYVHRDSPEETEADRMRHLVFLHLQAHRGWEDIMERECKA